MKPRTISLFHFTRSLQVLLRILEEGFWPRYCLEDIRWCSGNVDFFAMPIVSFCDIPISRLAEHTMFYGKYGIGLTRKWGIKKRLNPVVYLSKGSGASVPLLEMFKNPSDTYPHAKASVMNVMSFTKPLSGYMKVKGKRVLKDFYEECEWRYLPYIGPEAKYALLDEDEFNNRKILKDANEERRCDGMLTFTPDDVKYILVKRKQNVVRVVDFINSRLVHFPAAKIKILSTRVLALEEIARDL